MRARFKPHLTNLYRVRTSIDRDLENGFIIDRNERADNFSDEILEDIYRQFPNYIFNTYPDPAVLYQELSTYLNLKEEQIFFTFGSTGGIKVLYETLTNPGDQVMAISPTYPMYEVYSKIFQTEYKGISILEDFKLDLQKLHDDLNDDTALVCIANPNLPVETLISIDEINGIAERCRRHNTVLVIDEAYNLFGADSAVPLIDTYENLVILRTFSKAFGLAGVRLGYMLSQPVNIEYLSKTRSLVELSGPAIAVTQYMLKHPEISQNYVRSVHEGAQYIQEKLTELGINWHGGHYSNGLLIFLEDTSTAENLVATLKKQKIYIRGGFSPPYNRCVRVTMGPKKIMEIFLNAFHKCYRQ